MSQEPSHKSYDDVQYLSLPVPEADPLLMATIANLHGVETTDPQDADILEIGCGEGGNLLSLAVAYPGSRLTGFDPAEVPVARGRDMIERAGLGNVQLHHDDSAVDLDGSADYVIVHGVLTWVPDEARKTVFASAGRAARPGALVSFSYRAYPHAYYELTARQIGREAIEMAVEQAAERGETLTVSEQMAIARERLHLAASVASGQPHHGPALAAMLDKWNRTPDWNLFHDDLGGPLQPFHLTEVVAHAAEHGLRYVGELLPHDLWQHRLPAEYGAVIRRTAGPDAARRRQVADHLMDTGFHSSLFVKADDAPQLEPEIGDRPVYVRQFKYGTPDGDRLADEISAPVAQVIRERAPAAILATEIAEELGRDLETVHRELLDLHAHGLARLTTGPPRTVGPVGERPRTTSYVVEQIRSGFPFLSSRFHHHVELEASARRALLLLADGTRDRSQLLAELPSTAEATGLTDALDWVIENFDVILDDLARHGLLVAAED